MGTEIERKFLVRGDLWHASSSGGTRYRQGYLSTDPVRVVRVRIAGDVATLTIKGRTEGIVRVEYEYPIPFADAASMLDSLCQRPLVEKRRYRESFGGRIWEIDVFEGDNAGLVVAEVELSTPGTSIALPPWIGAEVSNDPRYFNSNLGRHPYSKWRSDASSLHDNRKRS